MKGFMQKLWAYALVCMLVSMTGIGLQAMAAAPSAAPANQTSAFVAMAPTLAPLQQATLATGPMIPAAASTPAVDPATVADLQAAQGEIDSLKKALADAQNDNSETRKLAEAALQRVQALEQQQGQNTPGYLQAVAEMQRLRADWQKSQQDAAHQAVQIAASQANALGIRQGLVEEMKRRIEARVQEFKKKALAMQQAATAATQTAVSSAAQDVATVAPAAAATMAVTQVAPVTSPAAVPTSASLVPAGVDPSVLSAATLQAQKAAQDAAAQAVVANQQAQAAAAQASQLAAQLAQTEKAIQDARDAEEKAAIQAAVMDPIVSATQDAAKQAEIVAAQLAPQQAPVVTAVNLPAGFEVEGQGLIDLTVGAYNNALEMWAVDSSNALRHWNSQLPVGSRFEVVNAVDASGAALTNFTSVSISSDGTLAAICAGKAFGYDWNSNQWSAMNAPADLMLDKISVGNSASIWAVDSKNQKIYQFTQSGWVSNFDGKAVSAGLDNTVVVLNSQGVASRRVVIGAKKAAKKAGGKARKKATGKAKKGAKKSAAVAAVSAPKASWRVIDAKTRRKLDDIAVVSKDLELGITQDTKELVQLVGKRTEWASVKGADGKSATGVIRIAANSAGTMAVIDAQGNVSRRGTAAVSAAASAKGKKKAGKAGTAKKGKAAKKSKAAKKGAARKGKASAKKGYAAKGKASAGKRARGKSVGGKAKKGSAGKAQRGTTKKSSSKKASGRKAGSGKKSASGKAKKGVKKSKRA